MIIQHWALGGVLRSEALATFRYDQLKRLRLPLDHVHSAAVGRPTAERWPVSGHSVVSRRGQRSVFGQHRCYACGVQPDSKLHPSASVYTVDEVRITLVPSWLFCPHLSRPDEGFLPS